MRIFLPRESRFSVYGGSERDSVYGSYIKNGCDWREVNVGEMSTNDVASHGMSATFGATAIRIVMTGLVATSVLLGGILGVVWLAKAFTRANLEDRELYDSTQGGLVVDRMATDLGQVVARADFDFSFRVDNPTPRALEVVDFHASCACTHIEPRAFTVLPGGSQVVTVGLDLLVPDENFVPRRPLLVRLNPIYSGDSVSSAGWAFTGQVNQPIRFTPPVLEFGDVEFHELGAVRALVAVDTFEPFEDLLVETSDPDPLLSVSLRRAEPSSRHPVPQPHEQFTMEVVLNDAVAVGPFDFEIGVRAVSASRDARLILPLKIKGRVPPDIRPFPGEILLGVRGMGETVRTGVKLRSRAGRRFRLQDIRWGDYVAEVEGERGVVFSAEHQISLTYLSAELGKSNSYIEIVVEEEAGQTEEVRVPILCHVIHLDDVLRLPPAARLEK